MPSYFTQKSLDSFADQYLWEFSLKASGPNTPTFALLDANAALIGSVCTGALTVISSAGPEISFLAYYQQATGQSASAVIPSNAASFVLGGISNVVLGSNGRRDGTVCPVSSVLYRPTYLPLQGGYYIIPNRKNYHKQLSQTLNFIFTATVSSNIVVGLYDRFGSQVVKSTVVSVTSGLSYDAGDLGLLGYSGLALYTGNLAYYDWTGDKSSPAQGENRLFPPATFLMGTAPTVTT